MSFVGIAVARPSLALIKYWGKDSVQANTPATGSLAVTLAGLESRTSSRFDSADRVVVNGTQQPIERFRGFLDALKSRLDLKESFFSVESVNNFPTSAGLASSSSGFAALAGSVAALSGRELLPHDLSALARLGSGSATRSVYGGFTLFDAGAHAATQVKDESFWPEFRVLVAIVREEAKTTSSRSAMESSRLTSPYYAEWVRSSAFLLKDARAALEQRDLPTLGPLIRQSYLRMFSTMFTAAPPLLYWKPDSLAIIQTLEELRQEGFQAWETMDAGPQVKIFCLADQLDPLRSRLEAAFPQLRFLTASPGPGVECWRQNE